MADATKKLQTKMAAEAHNIFPRGRTSIPAWTTTTSIIMLHRLTFDPSTIGAYKTTPLKTYFLGENDSCVRFIVDLFKIMKWVGAIQNPNAGMHLVPGARTTTPHGHYVTWSQAGLLKEFRANADEIDMALIQRIYDANLSHVEQGRCITKSVMITSVGQTLSNARVNFLHRRTEILKQIRAALDELHSIEVAHCNVRANNVFVLDDQRVILGDLKHCRRVDAAVPYSPDDEPCTTAIELDEYQYRKFEIELTEMGII